MSFNVGNLTGSIYINNILSGLADLPAFIIILLSAKLGRKISATISLFLGAATLISAAFMSAYLHEGEITDFTAMEIINVHNVYSVRNVHNAHNVQNAHDML